MLLMDKLSLFQQMVTNVYHIFRVNPIPLESGGRSECTLHEYVVRPESGAVHASALQGEPERSLRSLPEPSEVNFPSLF